MVRIVWENVYLFMVVSFCNILFYWMIETFRESFFYCFAGILRKCLKRYCNLLSIKRFLAGILKWEWRFAREFFD